jgi:Zn finger protein HypA/HybF involved in hydrogenase expression
MLAHRMIHDGDLADLLRNLPDSVHEYRLALARGPRREQNLDSRSQDTLAIMTQPQRDVLMVIMHTRSLRAAARQLNISHVALIGRLATIRKRLFTDPYQFQRGGNQRNGERMSYEPKERAMWCPVCGNEVKEAVDGQFCSGACKRDSINFHHEAAIRADREYDQYVADGLDRLLDDEREEGTDDDEEEDQDNEE